MLPAAGGAEESATVAPRLNPFAFPPETDFRFGQLIVATVGASLIIFTTLYNSVPATWEWKSAYYARCAAEARASYPSPSGSDLVSMQAMMGQCTAPADRREAAWLGGGALLIALITGLVYWLLPGLKIRRDGLIAVTPEDDPALVAYLAALCEEAGLTERPRFVWNPLNLTPNGVAFGRRGRYYVALSGGLVVQFHTDRPSFRAVMLHELAHLRNADVDKTYLAVGTGVAFLVIVLIPLALTMLGKPWGWIFQFGWRALALAGLVYMSLSAVLRAREFYADARASVWDGREGALRSVVARQPRRTRTGRWDAWRHVLKPHPDPAARGGMLDDTRPLFTMGYWEALGTGMAATIAFEDVQHLLSLLIPMWGAFLRPLGAALIFAPLAVGVVGLGVWRGTFAALLRNERPPGVGRLAVSMALGLMFGRTLSFGAFAATRSEVTLEMPIRPVPISGMLQVAFDVVWFGLLVAGMVLLLYWIAAGASAWLEVAARTNDAPRRAYRIGLGLAGCLLAVWLSMLFYAHAVRSGGGDTEMLSALVPVIEDVGIPITATTEALAAQGVVLEDTTVLLALLVIGMVGLTAISPLTLAVLMSVWAYPLTAWFWRRRGRTVERAGPAWAFLDAPSGYVPAPLSEAGPLRPGAALAAGGIGGLAVGAVFFALNSWMWSSAPALASELFFPWLLLVQPLLSTLAQGVVAAIVAARVRRLAVVHALFAAFTAGAVMALSVLWFSLETWGGTNLGLALTVAWASTGWSLNAGGLLALLAALAISAPRALTKPKMAPGEVALPAEERRGVLPAI